LYRVDALTENQEGEEIMTSITESLGQATDKGRLLHQVLSVAGFGAHCPIPRVRHQQVAIALAVPLVRALLTRRHRASPSLGSSSPSAVVSVCPRPHPLRREGLPRRAPPPLPSNVVALVVSVCPRPHPLGGARAARRGLPRGAANIFYLPRTSTLLVNPILPLVDAFL
jgi:hypothetical protein